MRFIGLGLCLLVLGSASLAWAAPADPVAGASGLLKRLLPKHTASFRLDSIPKEEGRDVYEIESANGVVILRGSSGVAIASALNRYLTDYAHCSLPPNGGPLALPEPLPAVPEKVRVVCPFSYRYCFNYCCFSYSMAWWDWPEWERAIDWMALHGINLPLAVTGQESVWREVGRQFGLSEEELQAFFVGPAYLPFGWMGCIDGWGGPLSSSWIDRHRELGQRILSRERELGMTPVLQGFTGHVPEALKNHFPDSAFRQLPGWCGFPGTTFVDPSDPLFQRVGTAFIAEQRKQFETDHFYASDTFIEMSPPSNDPAFLAEMGRAVYRAMAEADPEAVWVMQGWLFFNNPDFWQPAQAKALLGAVPDDRMLVLDLFCEANPVWDKTEAFHGKPWLWCIIQSFGNQVSLHGGLPQIAQGLSAAVSSPNRGRLSGAGFIMEGFGYNPVVYDLLGGMMWRPAQPDLGVWVAQYAHARYGKQHPKAEEAWRLLLNSVYRKANQTNAVYCRRPRADSLERRKDPNTVDAAELTRTAQFLAECAPELAGSDAFRYDLVHITREVLAQVAARRQNDMISAHERGDRAAFMAAGKEFLGVMDETDKLLATREEFLLGRWLEDAKRWASDDTEKQRIEWNARTQITLWGPKDGPLFDYAAKQWSGLISDFHKPRWRQFIEAVDEAMGKGAPFDAAAFDRKIRDWEEDWTRKTDLFPIQSKGDAVMMAQESLVRHAAETGAPQIEK